MLPSKSWFDKIFMCVGLTVLLPSCHDDALESLVPDHYVSFSRKVSIINGEMGQTEDQPQLESPGGYVRVYLRHNESDYLGYGGLLLVHSFDDTGFYAFDLACPYCFSQGAKLERIEMKEDGMTAICNHCSSEFGAIYWGSPAPTAGLANQNNYILRQYKAVLVGDVITVTR